MDFRSVAGFVTVVLAGLFSVAYGVVAVLQAIVEGRA